MRSQQDEPPHDEMRYSLCSTEQRLFGVSEAEEIDFDPCAQPVLAGAAVAAGFFCRI